MRQTPFTWAGGIPGYLAQFMLFVFAFGSLMLKRHREKPQRELRIWGMDVSKQVRGRHTH
jgi:hypothetical protein